VPVDWHVRASMLDQMSRDLVTHCPQIRRERIIARL
jgi:hypothetical protein